MNGPEPPRPDNDERDGMSFRQISGFLEIVRTKSITKAADEINLSPSGLSRILGNLELQVGEPLFQRGLGGLSLSQAGEVLLPHAVRLAELYAEALDNVGPSRQSGKLRICGTPSLLHEMISVLLQRSCAELLDGSLSIGNMSSVAVLRELTSGHADVGVCMCAELKHPDLEIIPLIKAKTGLMASKELQAATNIRTLPEARSLRFARLELDMVLPATLLAHEFDIPEYFSARIVTNSMESMYRVLEQCHYVTFASSIAAGAPGAKQLRFSPFDELPELYLCVAHPPNPSMRVRHLVDLVCQLIGEIPWSPHARPI